MHDKDMREKHFFNYNDVFATFWNALIFKSSTPAIDPDYLEDAPTEYVDIPKRRLSQLGRFVGVNRG